jgi:uridylate kinase
VMTSVQIEQFADYYIRRRALQYLESGSLLLLAGGTGSPYFTTDTAAALRAVEINAGVLLKATKVDGIYDKDPALNKDASLIKRISHTEVLKEGLGVMDATSVALCRDNGIPIIVFNMFRRGNLKRVIAGESLGSLIQ